MHRVVSREIPGAPHEVWLVLDATTGKMEFHRHRFFGNYKCNRNYSNKAGWYSKGGIVIAIRDLLGLPVKYIGLGEKRR